MYASSSANNFSLALDTGFVASVARLIPIVEQELIILPGVHYTGSLPAFFGGGEVLVSQFLAFPELFC